MILTSACADVRFFYVSLRPVRVPAMIRSVVDAQVECANFACGWHAAISRSCGYCLCDLGFLAVSTATAHLDSERSYGDETPAGFHARLRAQQSH